MRLLTFLKDYTLAIAMVIGVAGFRWLHLLSPSLPVLIFFMLFFTFCKVNPVDLRLHKWHWLLLVFQLVCSVVVYYALRPLDDALAQGIMLCFIMPSATAAPIIAGKLGGSIQSLTSFTMLSNIATAIVVPAFFPLVNPAADMSFWIASLHILRKVSPLLLGPFFAAWLLRLAYNAVQRKRGTGKVFSLNRRLAEMPFYLWAMSVVVLMAQVTNSLLYADYDLWVAFAQAGGSLVACLLQFYIGRKIGERYPSVPHGEDYQDVLISSDINTADPVLQTRISAGQALGQKNTTLGVWMANTYLNPIAAFGAAAYIIWQNLFNSWQLLHAASATSRKSACQEDNSRKE